MNSHKPGVIGSWGLSLRFWVCLMAVSLLPLLVSAYLVGIYLPPRFDFWELVLVGVVLSLCVGTLGLVLVRSATALVSRLSAQAERVAKGDLGIPIEVGTNGSIGQLADSLNSIQERLKRYTDEVDTQAGDLAKVRLDLRQKVSNLSGLFAVSNYIASSTDLDSLLHSLMDLCMDMVKGDAGLLMLVDGDQRLTPRVTRGLSDKTNLLINRKLAERTAASGKEQLLRDGKDQALGLRGLPGGRRIQSVLSLPLLVKTAIVGVIVLDRFSPAANFEQGDLDLVHTLANQVSVGVENSSLYRNLEASYIGTLASLVEAVEARDVYTRGHSERVAHYVTLIAKEMGIGDSEREAIRNAGLLHDIGKIGLRDGILRKKGSLTEQEKEEIKRHPGVAVKILDPIAMLRNSLPFIYHHHERCDGGGYPEGLKGEEIPLGARILAVADTFEAMTSDRPYRRCLSRAQAVEELKSSSGTRLDAKVVSAFFQVLEREKDVMDAARSELHLEELLETKASLTPGTQVQTGGRGLYP